MHEHEQTRSCYTMSAPPPPPPTPPPPPLRFRQVWFALFFGVISVEPLREAPWRHPNSVHVRDAISPEIRHLHTVRTTTTTPPHSTTTTTTTTTVANFFSEPWRLAVPGTGPWESCPQGHGLPTISCKQRVCVDKRTYQAQRPHRHRHHHHHTR